MTGNSRAGSDVSSRGGFEAHHRTKGLLRLTMACNERCSFCNVPVEAHADGSGGSADVEAELTEFIRGEQRTLTISGGEPTLLRRRLVALIADARARGMDFVELQTNAVRIDDDYAAELAAAGLTSAFVPILSHEPHTHDALVGREGAFAECLRGLDALRAAEIAVTLNVVIAKATERQVPAIVDFVAERLPGVSSISLSAVQPHGRAATRLELLPDYAVLGPAVRRAQQRAKARGIELLNPYCGLPVCVGWQDDLARCVEAVEAQASRGGRLGDVIGVVNRDDKVQTGPCRRCALRTRCGGAWRAYWSARNGSGLAPPLRRLEPWEPGACSAPGQSVVASRDGLTEATRGSLQRATTPTVWLQTSQLRPGDAVRLSRAGATDLALVLQPAQWLDERAAHEELRLIAEHNRRVPPQAALRTLLLVHPAGSFRERYQGLELAAALGVEAVRLAAIPGQRERFDRFAATASRELPLVDLAVIEGEVVRG